MWSSRWLQQNVLRRRHHLLRTDWTGSRAWQNHHRIAFAAGVVGATMILGDHALSSDGRFEEEEKGSSGSCTSGVSQQPRQSNRLLEMLPLSFDPFSRTTATTNKVRCDSGGISFAPRFTRLRRQRTVEMLDETKTKELTVKDKYDVNWKRPIGEGAFGAVYIGTNRATGERVAVKKITKKYTDNTSFQKEMDALQALRKAGGHPHICGLQENFEEGEYYYLVLDLISGGEMFDHLCNHGAYSEADAARLVREVASALAFIHGIGIVHGDMKPENIMLSSEKASDSVIKVVDFGCAQVEENMEDLSIGGGARPKTMVNTPAYSPPEIVDNKRRKAKIEPSFDMWALGCILYIMLTGVHPFDLYGDATDQDIVKNILSGKKPPLRKSSITAHLSKDAVRVIERLLQWNPKARFTAQDLLENRWVRGDTARTNKMADSDKRLKAYKKFRTKFEAKIFADMVSWGDDDPVHSEEVTKKTSLIERTFQSLNPDNHGFVTTKDLLKIAEEDDDDGSLEEAASSTPDVQLSLSGFADLLAENMKNRYFPKGHVIYREGDTGNVMYFLNSGTVEVYTKSGFKKQLSNPGDIFGEGALVSPDKTRNASMRCVTPVHAIEVTREYFEKYLAAQEGAKLSIVEKAKARNRQRTRMILRLKQEMKEMHFNRGEYLFKTGETGKDLYFVEEGKVNIVLGEHVVDSLQPGMTCGEQAGIFKKPRNVDAVCGTDSCTVYRLPEKEFYAFLDSHPEKRKSMREICMRREFQKAVCSHINKSFPKEESELREVFDAVVAGGAVGVDDKKSGCLDLKCLKVILKEFDPMFNEDNVTEILDSLDLGEDGKVNWESFRRIFGMSKTA